MAQVFKEEDVPDKLRDVFCETYQVKYQEVDPATGYAKTEVALYRSSTTSAHAKVERQFQKDHPRAKILSLCCW